MLSGLFEQTYLTHASLPSEIEAEIRACCWVLSQGHQKPIADYKPGSGSNLNPGGEIDIVMI